MVMSATELNVSLNTGAPATLPDWPEHPRHSPPLHAGLPAMRLVDPRTIEDMAFRSPHHARAWPLLEWLGATVRLDTGSPHLTANRMRDLERTLAGETPGRRPAILAAIASMTAIIPTTVEATDLALLRLMGLDVPACILLALARDVSEPLSLDSVQLVSTDGNRQAWLYPTRTGSATDPVRGIPGGRVRKLDLTTVTVGDGAYWSWGTLNVDGIPDSVVPSLAGRPLSDLITHPVIDALNLTITETGDEDGMHIVRTDFEPDHILVDRVMREYAVA